VLGGVLAVAPSVCDTALFRALLIAPTIWGASSRAQFPASVRLDLDKRGLVKNKLTGHRTSTMFDRYAIVSSVDVLLAQEKTAEFRKQA
jgi:hypothetical protein